MLIRVARAALRTRSQQRSTPLVKRDAHQPSPTCLVRPPAPAPSSYQKLTFYCFLGSETTPLLNGNQPRSAAHRMGDSVAGLFRAEGEPSWGNSMKFYFISWFNIFLVFVPLSAVAHYGNWDAKFRFTFSFLAIIPLAKVCHISLDRKRCLISWFLVAAW